MSGGDYSLTGGFWSFIAAVQTSGAPLLSIRLTTTNTAIVFWPSAYAGFQLQVNPNLATANWGVPAEPVQDNGSIKCIIINPATGSRFYRLKHP